MGNGTGIGAGRADLCTCGLEARHHDPVVPGVSDSESRLHRGPSLAGLAKLFHVLTDWDKYLRNVVRNRVGGHATPLMLAVGITEVVASIGVQQKNLRPKEPGPHPAPDDSRATAD